MKRITILTVVFLFLACGVASAGFFGPAKAQVDPGRVSIGLGLASSDEKWDFDDFGFAVDVQQRQAYIQAALGLPGTAELYTHLGLTTLEISDGLIDNIFGDTGRIVGDFSDSALFSTVGLKMQFTRRDLLNVGGFIEVSGYFSYDDAAGQVRMKVDQSLGANGGIVFQKEFDSEYSKNRAILYAGPFLHYRRADFKFIDSQGIQIDGTFKKDFNTGGFAGYRLFVSDDIVIDLEVQVRNKVSAAGGLSFLF